MSFSEAISLIESAERILITAHSRPDGDALGSMAALGMVIAREAQSRGRSCTVQPLLLSEAGDNYQFLLSHKPWVLGQEITQAQIDAGQLDQFDLIIVLDTSAGRQLPGINHYLKQRETDVLVIDHHLCHDPIGGCRIIDTEASAAGEIIFELCRQAHWALDEATATALFVAISTDTGWFRFENSSARAYRIASHLIEAGARPDRLYQSLYQNDPPERLKLLGLALQTLEMHCEGRLALMHITKAMLNESGAKRSQIENIVNEPQQIGSVILVALLVEQEDGSMRCSLRSKRDIDVNELAKRFGGGGHARAAGLTVDEPLTQARQKILDVMTMAARKLL